MKAWILDRLRERSTWAAIVTVAGVFLGRAIAPDQAEAITTLGVLVVGGIAAGSKQG